MTEIGQVMGRVVGEIKPGSRPRRGPAQSLVPVGVPPSVPVLPDDLRRQLEAMRWTPRDPLEGVRHVEPYHPDAERYADELRRALAPAPEELIRAWFVSLAENFGQGNLSAKVVLNGLLNFCGDLPAPVWCRAAQAELVCTHELLPGVPKIRRVLEAIAAPLRQQLRDLESIAKGDRNTRFVPGPAREAPPRPPERAPGWCFDKGPLAGKPPADYEQPQIQENIAAVRARELAKLAASDGLTVEELTALPKVRR